MPKAPAFQFYVKDWLSDPQLQSCSASTRGIWIDALCFMWEAPIRGKLFGTEESIRKLLRATNGDFTQFMEDAKRYEFVTVTFDNKNITLINRRMYREYNNNENNRLRQFRFREKHKSNAKVTPPSSSSSSCANTLFNNGVTSGGLFFLASLEEKVAILGRYFWKTSSLRLS